MSNPAHVAFVGRKQMLTAEQKEIVGKARELITPIDRWTNGTFARNRKDWAVSCDHDSAYRFCAQGALLRAAYLLGRDQQGENSCISMSEAISLKLTPSGPCLANINDFDSHAAILALFDKALAA
jgi:hypothetical protein